MQNVNRIKALQTNRAANDKNAKLGEQLSALLPGWAWMISKPCGQYQPNTGHLTEAGGMSLFLKFEHQVLTVVCTFPNGPTGHLRGPLELPSPFHEGKYRANISLAKSPERIAKEIRSRLIGRYTAAYAAATEKLAGEVAKIKSSDDHMEHLRRIAGDAGNRSTSHTQVTGRHRVTLELFPQSRTSAGWMEMEPYAGGRVRIPEGAYIPNALAEVICRWAAEHYTAEDQDSKRKGPKA